MATGMIKKPQNPLPTAWALIGNQTMTNTATNVSVQTGRSLADYDLLLFAVRRGNYFENTAVIPRWIFEGYAVNMTEASASGNGYWYDFTFVNNTTVKIQSSSNASDVHAYVYGIGPTDMS